MLTYVGVNFFQANYASKEQVTTNVILANNIKFKKHMISVRKFEAQKNPAKYFLFV